MSWKRSRLILVLAVMLMITSACGGNGGESSSTSADSSGGDQNTVTEPDNDQNDDQDSNDSANQGGRGDGLPGGGADGSFTVDGESYDATVFRCEPFSASGPANPDELDLRAFFNISHGIEVEVGYATRPAPAGPPYEATVVFVFYSRQGDAGVEQFEGAASTGPDGTWYPDNVADLDTATPLDQPAIEISGSRITGALSGVEQDWPQGATGTVDIMFDLEVPNDFLDNC